MRVGKSAKSNVVFCRAIIVFFSLYCRTSRADFIYKFWHTNLAM